MVTAFFIAYALGSVATAAALSSIIGWAERDPVAAKKQAAVDADPSWHLFLVMFCLLWPLGWLTIVLGLRVETRKP